MPSRPEEIANLLNTALNDRTIQFLARESAVGAKVNGAKIIHQSDVATMIRALKDTNWKFRFNYTRGNQLMINVYPPAKT